MFTSIIDTTTGSISVGSLAICFVAALVLGIIISLVYMYTTERYTKNFAITLILLPVLVQIVLLAVNGNLGTSIAVMGTFGLIRFRSIPGTSKEIVSIFFAMAIGVSCAMGQIVFAIIFTVIISLLLLILSKSNYGEQAPTRKHLKITIPEDLDYTGIFNDIFEKYTKKTTLEKVKTINLGSMYVLDYQIELINVADEKKMIDELRIRNGNLAISCGIIPDKDIEM